MLKYFKLLVISALLLNGCVTGPTPKELAQDERIRIEQKQLSLQQELQKLISDNSDKSIRSLLNFSNNNYEFEVSKQAYHAARKRIQEIGRTISGNELETFISKCKNPPGKIYVSKLEDPNYTIHRISIVTVGGQLDHISLIGYFRNIGVQTYKLFVNGSEREIVYKFKDQAWIQTF